MKLALTIPAGVQFREVAQHSAVEAIRLNTNIPPQKPLEDLLIDMKQQADPKELWIDLKARQLRIEAYHIEILGDKEIHEITLTHKINLDLPQEMWIDDGKYSGIITRLQKHKTLVVESSLRNKTGLPLQKQEEPAIIPGMAINIPSKSLEVKGYLTNRDIAYIKAGRDLGLNTVCVSYFERGADLLDILSINPNAKVIAKIESEKGLDFVRGDYATYKQAYDKRINLMAARGDLYVEIARPDQIIDACEEIIRQDPDAIFASRIFSSLTDVEKIPECRDLFDIYCGMKMGYKRFLLGDELCLRKESVEAAIGLFNVIEKKWENYK